MDSDSCCPPAQITYNIKFYKNSYNKNNKNNKNIILEISKVPQSMIRYIRDVKDKGEIFSILAYFKIILNQVSDKRYCINI